MNEIYLSDSAFNEIWSELDPRQRFMVKAGPREPQRLVVGGVTFFRGKRLEKAVLPDPEVDWELYEATQYY